MLWGWSGRRVQPQGPLDAGTLRPGSVLWTLLSIHWSCFLFPPQEARSTLWALLSLAAPSSHYQLSDPEGISFHSLLLCKTPPGRPRFTLVACQPLAPPCGQRAASPPWGSRVGVKSGFCQKMPAGGAGQRPHQAYYN